MNRAKAFAVAAVFLFTILLGACQSSKHLNNAKNTPDYERIDKTHYTIQIHAHDGTKLKATVFQPELVPGEEAPLVIQTHGFGGFRMSGERSLWGKFVITGQAALEAWDQGYWVISYDQRGFGGSGGDVQMMHPDYEVQDLGAVIDWAYEHLPRLKLDDVGDPRVGVIGENYAAGLQVLASIFDHRIDAIVPVTSWYNLADAMAPNGLNKTAWGGVAGYMGTMSSGFDMGIMLKPEVRKSMGSKLADETKAFLAERSPQTYCEREEFPQADALLIQGFRDTMFSINHAVQNKLCIEQGGNEAKLIGVQDGNLLPSQKLFGFPFFHIDEKVNCGEHKFKTTDMIVRWFNEKLKDVRGAANKIPEYCMTQDYESGVIASNMPRGGRSYSLNSTTVKPGMAGGMERILKQFDRIDLWPFNNEAEKNVTMANAKATGGNIRQAFTPVLVAQEDGVMAGIPVAEIVLTSKTKGDPIVFVGIGKREAGSRLVKLLGDQVHPITKPGFHKIDLPAVSTKLKKGDVIGVVMSGINGQYIFNGKWIPTTANISGRVELPMLKKSNDELFVLAY